MLSKQYDTRSPAKNEMTYGQNPAAMNSALLLPTAAIHAEPSTVNQIAPNANITMAPAMIPT